MSRKQTRETRNSGLVKSSFPTYSITFHNILFELYEILSQKLQSFHWQHVLSIIFDVWSDVGMYLDAI